MKFTDMVMLYVAVGLILITAAGGLRLSQKLEKLAEVKKKETESMYFISESFRNTCCGKGFDSLNEWQTTCRALWKLDYIGWSKAEEFMADENGKAQNNLFYGKWSGTCGGGEVFCRKKKDLND